MKYSVAISEPLSRSYPAPFQGDIPEGILWAKRLGFNAVELHLKDAGEIDAAVLRGHCAEAGMSVSAISTGRGYTIDRLSLIDDDAGRRSAAVRRLMEHIDLAGLLGCSVIIGLMRGIIPDMSRREEYLERFSASMARLLEHAEKKEAVLVIEAINRFQTNYLLTVAETVEFVGGFRHPLLKVHVDTFHMNMEDEDMVQAIYHSKDCLGYVHYSENNRGLPGSGQIDFRMLTKSLLAVGYKGYIGLEFTPATDPTGSTAACLGYLKSMEEILDRWSKHGA